MNNLNVRLIPNALEGWKVGKKPVSLPLLHSAYPLIPRAQKELSGKVGEVGGVGEGMTERGSEDGRERSETHTAVDIQRRLELREFFMQRNDMISAGLVEDMFRIASFEALKAQVLKLHGDLPRNWKDDDRYQKYKDMLSKGVTKKKVRKQMLEDGLDPEELGFHGQGQGSMMKKLRFSRPRQPRKLSQSPSQSRSTGAASVNTRKSSASSMMSLNGAGKALTQLTRTKNAMKRRKKGSAAHVRETVRAKDSHDTLTMDTFERRKEKNHMQMLQSAETGTGVTSSSRFSVFSSGRLPGIRTARAKSKNVITLRDTLADKTMDKTMPIRPTGISGVSTKSTSTDDKKGDDEIKIDPRHRSQFLYSAKTINQQNVRETVAETKDKLGALAQTQVAPSEEQLAISKLTSRNKVGHIHDFRVYFPKTESTIGKTSVSKISRRATEINTQIPGNNARKAEPRQIQHLGDVRLIRGRSSVFDMHEVVQAVEDDGEIEEETTELLEHEGAPEIVEDEENHEVDETVPRKHGHRRKKRRRRRKASRQWKQSQVYERESFDLDAEMDPFLLKTPQVDRKPPVPPPRVRKERSTREKVAQLRRLESGGNLRQKDDLDTSEDSEDAEDFPHFSV